MNFVKIIPPTIAAAPNRVMFRVLHICSVFTLDKDFLNLEVYPPDSHRGVVVFRPPRQGALAVETRESGYAKETCESLDHTATRAAVTAERAVLAALGGGCQVPIGAYAEVEDEMLRLIAVVISPDGGRLVRENSSGPVREAERLGSELGDRLLAAGAREILEQVYSTPGRDAAV